MRPTVTRAETDAAVLAVLGAQVTQAMISGRISIGERVRAACLEAFAARRDDSHAEVLRQAIIQLNADLGWKS